jgi:hypothetical protein
MSTKKVADKSAKAATVNSKYTNQGHVTKTSHGADDQAAGEAIAEATKD